MDAADILDPLFVTRTLGCEVIGVAVEDIHVLFADVYVAEEVIPHEAVITLRVLFRQVHILVHIKGDHIAERHLSCFVQFNQGFVHAKRRTTGRETEHKRLALFRAKLINFFCYIVRSPLTQQVIRRFNNYSHISIINYQLSTIN